jgi:hypothetical protein
MRADRMSALDVPGGKQTLGCRGARPGRGRLSKTVGTERFNGTANGHGQMSRAREADLLRRWRTPMQAVTAARSLARAGSS